ncbi:OSBL6 protein, partial [Amia calva]|nr:OSBL6 protein [Amia calva]
QRYFVLDKGILGYAKTPQDIAKGKLHGSIDVSLAVMSINKKSRRIDLDAGDSLYHLKVPFQVSVSGHLYRNPCFSLYLIALQCYPDPLSPVWFQPTYNRATPLQSLPPGTPIVTSKVDAWLQQTQNSDFCSQGKRPSTPSLPHSPQSSRQGAPGSVPTLNCHFYSLSRTTHWRNPGRKPARSGATRRACPEWRPVCIPDYVHSQAPMPPETHKLQHNICSLSQRVHTSLKSVLDTLYTERERLRQAWSGPDLRQATSAQFATLYSTMSESHLTRVHSLSLSSDSTDESFRTVNQCPLSIAGERMSLASTQSYAEYFDASDVIVCGSSDENEASDDSCLSDVTNSNSDPEDCHTSLCISGPRCAPKDTGRRKTIPAPGPDNSHIGLWNILYNNMGKDLSRVSMPVPLNEPLCFLQRLCEELEYCELLDTANRIDDPYERMVYVAAFAISYYLFGSSRNRYKPFNPVLGETYECLREDKGFRYVAEQVSHHPPISACYAESENFTFWQDQRWKNKFWGKSVEVIPVGMVNITLPKYGDHYEWNKVTTCIHNILSPQRWLEHYGEILIRNTKDSSCTCKITLVKSRYFSPETNEVRGVVLDQAGNTVHKFGGFWHEGIFCDTLPTPQCIWKPHPLPPDHMQYYGFSYFARELNDVTPEMKSLLPPTDSRFRPDQRLLENGHVDEAEKKKDEVEQQQRERRKMMEKKGEQHIPRFFRKMVDATGKETWFTNGTYWKVRKEPGFAQMDNPQLW